jgi:hypothetical protein
MTNLNKLAVSLTKHGAHKIAKVLDSFPLDQVLKSTSDTIDGINIDAAQARKTLSAGSSNAVPTFWFEAKKFGPSAVKKLVLLGIVFSHHRLIEAMISGISGFGVGSIARTSIDGGKGFTNFKDDFRELGFIAAESVSEFRFDIRPIITDKALGPLALRLFQAKLTDAAWDRKTDAIDECLKVRFNSALGMSAADFRSWVAGEEVNLDEVPEISDPDEIGEDGFKFKAGHNDKKIGDVVKTGHGETATARLIHNDLQSKMFNFLNGLHPGKVGTEVPAGVLSTHIDAVVDGHDGYVFYEIKTSTSLRKCIREAFPQLIEYSCWPDAMRAVELIIVSMNKPTNDAKAFLNHLRSTYKIPIYHETIDQSSGTLSNRI